MNAFLSLCVAGWVGMGGGGVSEGQPRVLFLRNCPPCLLDFFCFGFSEVMSSAFYVGAGDQMQVTISLQHTC